MSIVRIVALFWTLLVSLSAFWGISSIGSEWQGSEINTPALRDTLFSSYQLMLDSLQLISALIQWSTEMYTLHSTQHILICNIATFGTCPTMSHHFSRQENFPVNAVHRLVLRLVKCSNDKYLFNKIYIAKHNVLKQNNFKSCFSKIYKYMHLITRVYGITLHSCIITTHIPWVYFCLQITVFYFCIGNCKIIFLNAYYNTYV